MKRFLTITALSATLALGVLSPAALAKGSKAKPSAEHVAALKKCSEDYKTAMTAAKGMKGAERTSTRAAARKARAECRTSAPK